MGIEPFDYSATQRLNESCILGVVIEDSLTRYHSARCGNSTMCTCSTVSGYFLRLKINTFMRFRISLFK